MFLQNQVNELINRSWNVDPTNVYGLFVGGTIILTVTAFVVAQRLFVRTEKKLEEKERQMVEERHRAQERYDKLANELMAAKIEAVGALRDVLHALNVLSVSQSENTETIIDTVDRMKGSVLESINRIK